MKFSIYLNRRVIVLESSDDEPILQKTYFRIRTDLPESFLSAFWIAKDANLLHADNEDSDQTARIRRLI